MTSPCRRSSPFWALPQVVITPHSAGETRAYEGNVVDILLDNLGRLARGETACATRSSEKPSEY
jgi:D-2-hydroxyacid dehydrogenase (NADP+)